MKNIFLTLLIVPILGSCQTKNTEPRNVGGPCEGCEALYEYGDRSLNSIDTISGFLANESKIHLSGIIYREDGKTPAENVILYAYHTNANGIYEVTDNESGWGRRHGKYRGWVKTEKDGRYDFYTFRPASYPNTTIPQHIHITVKDENTIPYYIDDILFTDDPLLTKEEIKNRPNRAGSGIVTPIESQNGILEIRRDIILGKNIPNY
ncbi:MAG: intradiol ring-cleavage dioxygenase [Ekhidna sp.]|uniref:intradiol ring-cleavage dioxygenase n=1 Tax=Ekhidna sp. TaxID=2608089 RepID=UPI0032EB3A77